MTPTTLFRRTSPSTAASTVPTVDSTVRLSLNPTANRRSTVDGTWWPYSRDATAELPSLIAAADQRLGRTTLHVELYRDAWEHIPRLVPARGRQVRVDCARHADPRVVTLLATSGRPVVLLVVPPDGAGGSGTTVFAGTAEDTITAREPIGPAGGNAPTVVRLTDDIDIFTSAALRRRLLDALRRSTGLLILDLSRVASCDAGGLAVMVGIRRRARAAGITLALAAPPPYLSRLLRSTGLDRHLPVVA